MKETKKKPKSENVKNSETGFMHKAEVETKDIKVGNCPKGYCLCPDDIPTRFAGLGWRVILSIFGWVMLGKDITPGPNYFVALILCFAPLFMDYIRFKPKTKFRSWLRKCGLSFSGMWISLGAFGLGDVIRLVYKDKIMSIIVTENFLVLPGSSLPYSYIWGIMAISILLTIVDWVVYENDLEKELTQEQLQSIRSTS